MQKCLKNYNVSLCVEIHCIYVCNGCDDKPCYIDFSVTCKRAVYADSVYY